jgi:hypothetical protein
MDPTRPAPIRTLLTALTLLLALMAGLASAQRPLAAYAPADALVTLSATVQEHDLGSFGAELAALDWAKLGDLIERGAEMIDDRDIEEMLEVFGGMREFEDAFAEIEAECPGLGDPLEALMGNHAFGEALLTVSLSPFNPVPAVSAFARVDAGVRDSADAVQTALARCFGDTTFEQDGVPFTLLGDGSDLPVLIGTVDDVFVVSSSPDVLRAAIRMAGGSSEPSLADTALWRASADMAPGGVGLTVDFATLADTLENFIGLLNEGPEVENLINRALGSLRTVGGYAGRLGLSDEGVRFETLLAVNPDGGDDALAELLLCRACTVGRPFLAPADLVAVDSQYLPIRELFSYLQSWLDDIGPAVGEQLDLEQLLRDELGFDLDAALLDWIGNQIHTVQLAPFRPDVRTLIYNPPTAYLIPVASVEQAEAGIAMLGRAIEPLAREMMSGAGSFGALNDFGDFGGLPSASTSFAVRDTSYRGVDITRIQASINFDVGVAFVGNHLVIGSPASAVEPLIDTFLGAANVLTNRGYVAARDAAPRTLSTFSYSDVRSSLYGVHELLDALVQPLAGVIDLGLQEAMRGSDSFGDDFGGGGFADLFGLVPTQMPLQTGASSTIRGDLTPDDADNFGDFGDYFELSGLEAGDLVSAVVTSDSFDTYLFLIDANNEEVLVSDDDSPDTSRSQIEFRVEPGVRYWVQVGSFGGTEVGAYTLDVSVAAGEMPAMQAGPPTFVEILEALELLPQAAAVLAEHIDSVESYTRVEGNGVAGTSLIRIDW